MLFVGPQRHLALGKTRLMQTRLGDVGPEFLMVASSRMLTPSLGTAGGAEHSVEGSDL
jgi:hypothetical protein